MLVKDAKNDYLMIDSTIVRAHQHAAGSKKKRTRLLVEAELDRARRYNYCAIKKVFR